MRPRLVLRRISLWRWKRSSPLRTYTHHTSIRTNGGRPQLPFLSIPTTTRQTQRVRYLTTERKQWIKYEVKLGLKYTVYFWIAICCVGAGAFAIQQEILERQYPTPHEWRFLTRTRFKSAHAERDRADNRSTDWVVVMELVKGVVERLEDPKIDGRGVKDAAPDAPPLTKDISAMSEPWRRGYYEAMMLYAMAAEHLDGWVMDKTRNIAFPPEVVVGPSNPRPKPVPAGAQKAPREEDCEVAYPAPDDIYMKIISTEGFTPRQRMDAALAYANYLEYKGVTGPASVMYERALSLAISSRPSDAPNPVNQKTWVLDDSAGPPTSNILASLTALATFQARIGNVSTALPVLVSILKARRSLPLSDKRPVYQSSALGRPNRSGTGVMETVLSLIWPPPYTVPPGDGNTPPVRGPKELCEEAALLSNIGEIIYATRPASREEGIAWTREAVDIAEEQLHRLGGGGGRGGGPATAEDRAALKTCRDCLSTGLTNWDAMVARLAREEAARREAATGRPPKKASWFALWGEGEVADQDRWAAEERVVQDRRRRAAELLDELEPPKSGGSSIFIA
ncbi:hypothetical protein VTK73DRAFT_2761 [Phialemonium thermophilum]|uniref:MFS maltose permease n=1 Tax=Phialemonium thermophilum TaxID=223376 RepID=A0ABR3Y183_9PEZI